MIQLRNGHRFQFMASSGAFGFDGQGWWFWEKPLIKLGLINPRLLTIVTKTITKYPRKGNPYRKSIRPIPGGAVNCVGLRNPGMSHWLHNDVLKINRSELAVMLSITAKTQEELVELVNRVLERGVNIKGIEFNSRYMASDDGADSTNLITEAVRRLNKNFPNLPLIVKLSYSQNYVGIARRVRDMVDAVSINSIPAYCLTQNERASIFRWYGGKDPMEKFGGGSISGGIGVIYQKRMIKEILSVIDVPVIGPGVRRYSNLAELEVLGVQAFSFGHVFLPFAPWWRPKRIIRRYLQNKN